MVGRPCHNSAPTEGLPEPIRACWVQGDLRSAAVAWSGDHATTRQAPTRGQKTVPPAPTAGLHGPATPSPRNRCERDLDGVFPLRQIPRRRRKPPMLCGAYQPAAARIIVDIIDLLLPEPFLQDRLRMATRLPQAALAVGAGLLPQSLRETAGKLALAVIAQLPPSELPEISERPLQPVRVEVTVEHDQVQVRRHDHEGIDAQAPLAMAKG